MTRAASALSIRSFPTLLFVVACLAAGASIEADRAGGAPTGSGARRPRRAVGHVADRPRAPTGPPLVAGSSPAVAGSLAISGLPGTGGGDASASAASGSGDPLVENGLSSPLCAGAAHGELSAEEIRDCRGSGFDATGAPTSNYAFDVHIDTGTFGFGAGAIYATAQDLILAPVWNGLVWIVHALVVALEWCYTLDLLDSPALGTVVRALRGTQAVFTQPWLAIVLAVAAVLALYHGIVRRRVAQTLGEVLLMLAMMAAGLWVIMNPLGTVGALGRWAEQASLGTLAAASTGSPQHPARTLADAARGIFDAAVGKPWCYMEFGDVRWCSDPARLDPRLHAAAQRLLNSRAPGVSPASASLLRAAKTNGDLFLALPANQSVRNSINERDSLLSALCGGGADATSCRGSTAAEAQFRTQDGTGARFAGLFLIGLGALGMVLLLGFLALHLLGAALATLFYLLLAPVAVLAPALGDGGRAAFRTWAGRLFAAVVSKLLYSFLLGVVLALARILASLDGLGWWVEWLLLSTLWWGAFHQRHQLLGVALREQHDRRPRPMRLQPARLARGRPSRMLRTLVRDGGR